MKIIFLITKLDYSGGPKMLAWVANQFAKAGHNVEILSIYSDLVGQQLEENVKFYALNYSINKNRIMRNSIDMIKVVNGVNKHIMQEEPDLVISFLYAVDLFYLIKAKKNKQRMIISMRLDPYSEKGISAMVKHCLTKLADGLVFQTDGAKDFYGNKIRDKSIVIPNPVTDKTLSFSDKVKSFCERKNIIVVPARLNVKQKRQDLMIKAFNIVYKTHPDYRLVFLGDGEDKEKLKEMTKNYGLSEAIEFHRSIPTAEEYTVNCKIVALSSDYEGIPNALIEALGLGLNVVATDCSPGGAKMLIEDGINGFVVNRGDYKAIAEKINFYIENPYEADKIGMNARNIKNKFSEQIVANKWIDFAEKICM